MRWSVLVAAGLALAGQPVPLAHAEAVRVGGSVSFVDRLGCGRGLTPVATGIGPGSTLVSGFTTTAVAPVVQLSTQRSGFPPVAITFASTPTPGRYERFDRNRGGDLDPEYALGALEVARPDPAQVIGWETVLPAPQRLFFTMLDFEFDAEAATVLGFDGTRPVTPLIIPRVEPGGSGVAVFRHPDGSMIVTGNIGVDLDDYDPEVTADVVFTEPVDRVRVIQSNPTGAADSTSVEYSTMYGCQGLDVVKQAGAARAVPRDGPTLTYDIPFTVIVGNTARPGDMAVYEPQVTDNLADLVRETGTIDAITSLAVTGPQPACRVNPTFDGRTQPRLLAGAGALAGGEFCTVTYVARVSVPSVTRPHARASTAVASSRGTASDVAADAAVLPSVPHGDGSAAAAVRFVTAAPSTRAGRDTPLGPGEGELPVALAGGVILLLGVLLVAVICLRVERRQDGT